MTEHKHYNRGVEIATTFPISKAELRQQELNKETEKQLKVQEKQNKEQAELIAKLHSLLEKKDKQSDN
jgi:hypothetical protein